MDRFEQEAMDLEADIIRNLSERAAPRIAAWGRKCASDARREAFKETLKKWQRMDGLHSAGIFYDWLESQAKGGA